MYTECRPLDLGRVDVSNPTYWESLSAESRGATQRSRDLIEAGEIWRAVQRRIPDRARFLDAGCGAGEWIDFLSSHGYPATGLDYCDQTIERNRKACPTACWVSGTIQNMPFVEAEFDCVISWGVIEHDEAGPQLALREFSRILTPNGWLFVTVPLDSPCTRRSSEAQFPDTGRKRGFFQYFFTADELASQLIEAQFAVETIIPVSPAPLPVLFPRVYRFAHPLRKWKIEGLCSRIMNPLFGQRREAFSMYLAIARKTNKLS